MPLERRMSCETTVTLADFTAPGLIVPRLLGQDMAGVIQELARVLQREGRVPDVLPFYNAALNHEFLVSSDTAAGVAVPHARLPGVTRLSFAFGRCEKTLAWSARGSRPVQLVFLLAVPASDSAQYLLLISSLARLCEDGRLLETLRATSDPVQIFALFQQVRLRSHTPSDALPQP